MDVRSLGFRTDLALLTASGSVVEDRGTHLVVRTPGTTWAAAYGGTRTSTEFPGARSARTARKCLTRARVSPRAVASTRSAAERARSRAGTGAG